MKLKIYQYAKDAIADCSRAFDCEQDMIDFYHYCARYQQVGKYVIWIEW